jgi:protein TonB
MLGVLLESRARRARSRGGAIVSVGVHTGLILLAVVATGRPTVPPRREPPDRVVPIYMQPTAAAAASSPASAPQTSARSDVTLSAPPPLPLIDVVPDGIPPISSTATPGVIIEQFGPSRSVGARFGIARSRGAGIPGSDGIAFESGVEKPAFALPGNPSPSYPGILRNAGVEGRVVVQVAVDTLGRAEMETFKLVSSDHQMFTDAVLKVLPRFRFIPAETGVRKVRMWVIIPFEFVRR